MSESAVTIDATVGGASSNSFLTLAAAELLIHSRPFHSAWDDITVDDQKESALIHATRILNRYRWQGIIASTAQMLAFPRSSLYDYDGREYAADAIPAWLEEATAELAFIMATEDRLSDTGTEGFSEIKVASIEVKVDKYDRPDDVPDRVLDIIKPYIKQGAAYNAGVTRV